ncbi:MAG: AbrB/MazE/SpoVT family DNA-binding domain-containing protein [Actinobacteria bacterium]|nr:AbrB/MazE/SpoVT family DNA-binding domain-containing protein [Actinomycetota bacterium]MBU1942048.1 AbrB/MazE/SpoVT family DNA-binding domain-containing protein [Actinomycetota bacterium]MBU2687181.1 AbrB/MazE/SpoVT family DNA-binding domain-containing protein [Actinomycetota bacterium]
MAAKSKTCCEPVTTCRVESVLNVDERGQMVLPKDVRSRAGIKPGDKLAVVTHERDGEVCCITLVKADALTEMVKGVLGPVLKDITG